MTMAITFPRQNDAGLRMSKTQYQENLVLIVVLVSVLSSVYPRLSLRAQVLGFEEHDPWLLSLENEGKIP